MTGVFLEMKAPRFPPKTAEELRALTERKQEYPPTESFPSKAGRKKDSRIPSETRLDADETFDFFSSSVC